MTTTVKARTALKAHRCDHCNPAGADTEPVIAPGHRYLLHTVFPDSKANPTGRPLNLRECMTCFADRDEYGAHLEAGACGTFCHGVTPCARLFGHAGDHSCRECARYNTAEAGGTR